MQLHHREYLTLDEVQSRWKCSANDLKSLIVAGHLVPSFIINHVAKKVRFSWQADCEPPYWLPVVVKTEVDGDWDEPPSNLHDTEGMYYLLYPDVDAALSCRFFLFSTDRNHQLGPDEANTCFMFSLRGRHPLSQGISLEMVLDKGMITMAEIERYEAEQMRSTSARSASEGDLSNTGAKNKPLAGHWEVIKPSREQGYNSALFRTLLKECQEGRKRPTAREVMTLWRNCLPPEVEKVLHDGIDYYDASGNTKTASVRAITNAINRMTTVHPE